MRILFVWTAAEFSTMDVARGYRLALGRQGHEIYDYRLSRRMMYHANALQKKSPGESAQDIELLSRLASENVLIEAIRHRAELVIIISALSFHPDGVWFLARCSIPTAVIFTESPYCDPQQVKFAEVYPEMVCATQDRMSARQLGWTYLAPAYDPDIHKPVDPDPAEACDVIMIGTGWPERVKLIEAIDWTGIKLRLLGPWKQAGCPEDSPIVRFVEDKMVNNLENARYYASAKICLNLHRADPDGKAESINPRIVEAAGCGAFQLSDDRAELREIFGTTIPTFTDSADLARQIRFFLGDDEMRRQYAAQSRERGRGETFDARAATLLDAVARRQEMVAV